FRGPLGFERADADHVVLNTGVIKTRTAHVVSNSRFPFTVSGGGYEHHLATLLDVILERVVVESVREANQVAIAAGAHRHYIGVPAHGDANRVVSLISSPVDP